MRRAKIVCTLGPAVSSYEQIKALVEAGMDVARLNLSHGSHDDHHANYVKVRQAAEEVGRTPAQVALRWHLQRGVIAIPKSVTPARIVENMTVFDFKLTDKQLAAVERLDRDQRGGPDPETFDRR